MLTDCFETCTVENGSNVIMGDFNLPYIKWDSLQCPDEYIHKIIFDFVISHRFAQLVKFSTRELNTLNLVFTDNDCLISMLYRPPYRGCRPP